MSLAIREASVTPGFNSDFVILVDAADHVGHRDCLAERAAEGEHRRRRHPRGGGGQHDAADDLPAGGAERRCPSWSSGGTVRKRSRLSEATIGTIMIVSTSPALNRLRPVVSAGANRA